MKKLNVNNIKKILVIQTAFLGDIVLTIPLLNNIKRLWPKKELYILTTPIGKEILSNQKSIDGIIVYDKKGRDKGFKNFLSMSKDIKDFDLVIMPHRSLRTSFLSFCAGIPHRWGFASSEGKFLLTKKIFYDKNKHDLERNLDFLADFSPKFDDKIEFPMVEKIDERVRTRLKSMDFIEKKIIGVNPDSVWPTKRWSLNNFKELIERLVKKDYKIIIFGDAKDRIISDFIDNNFSAENYCILNLYGHTSISELVGYMRYLSLYVTNDSGPMHIAAALGIPIVAIFGPTVKSLGFYPYTKKSIVIEKRLSCRPCGKHGGMKCPIGTHKCMNDITVDEVEQAVEKLINN